MGTNGTKSPYTKALYLIVLDAGGIQYGRAISPPCCVLQDAGQMGLLHGSPDVLKILVLSREETWKPNFPLK